MNFTGFKKYATENFWVRTLGDEALVRTAMSEKMELDILSNRVCVVDPVRLPD